MVKVKAFLQHLLGAVFLPLSFAPAILAGLALYALGAAEEIIGLAAIAVYLITISLVVR